MDRNLNPIPKKDQKAPKQFLEPTYVFNQLWFWKYSPIFLFLTWPHLGPLLHFFGPIRCYFFVALWGYFGLGSASKTYLCRQSILVLEVQSYLFVFDSAKFWAYLHFLGFLGLSLGFGSGSKTFLGPAYID